MSSSRVAFTFVASILGCACSSSTTTTTIDDGGTSATGDGAVASSVCNAIANAAPAVPFSISSDAVPTATGGTIEDGTYFETQAIYYTMDDAGVTASELGTVQTTIVITNGVAQTVTKSSLGGDATTATSKLTMNGTTLVTSDSCPDTRATTSAYSATATSVTLYIAETSTLTAVDVFTKQ